jgi:hypothetical protein
VDISWAQCEDDALIGKSLPGLQSEPSPLSCEAWFVGDEYAAQQPHSRRIVGDVGLWECRMQGLTKLSDMVRGFGLVIGARAILVSLAGANISLIRMRPGYRHPDDFKWF